MKVEYSDYRGFLIEIDRSVASHYVLDLYTSYVYYNGQLTQMTETVHCPRVSMIYAKRWIDKYGYEWVIKEDKIEEDTRTTRHHRGC